ncbi:MAG: AAA-like domain-containing protein [Anaerolineales bacterium]|nr:AAA-like domain-containing protein [Anaerolineales bacterium]
MRNSYNLPKIRKLLTEGFTDDELRNFSFDTPDFRPVYDKLAQSTGKADIIGHLLEHAEQKVLLEALLAWAKEHNPTRFEAYQPYFNKAHIFISYKRNVTPDEPVAQQLFEALNDQYDVFIDKTMLVGTPWIEHIEAQLRQTDFLIILLSAESIVSEMVLAEIEMAQQLAQTQVRRPTLRPVRLAYREPFQYPLSAHLNPLNWASWENETDTPQLIEELKQAISGGALSIDDKSKVEFCQVSKPASLPRPLAAAQPVCLESPEGTIDAQSVFYVKRFSDGVALETIARQGATITIKAPRQMGKSSLLIQTINAAAKSGKRIAFLDFQLFDQSALTDADIFFRQFCAWLTDELKMADQSPKYWESPLGYGHRCTRFMSRYLLPELNKPLVLAMDEVDQLFDADFRSDFFSMLRNWHNRRANEAIWKQLDLVLVTSTEPYQLIENPNESPFNVGEIIELQDFTLDQVTDLNRRHGLPLTPAQVQQLMDLLNGHPYLIRRGLYLVASQRISITNLFANAGQDHGPFGDHLRYHLFRLHQRNDLIQGLHQVIQNHTCHDDHICFRLQGAGLVRRQGREVWPRCQLYADFFGEHLRD